MAQVQNPHKQFQFSISLFGMNPFLAQKVTTAEREVAAIGHGEGNHTIKTAGMITLGNVLVEKLFNNSVPEKLMWAWIRLAQDEFLGGGTVPDIYKKALQVQHLAVDGASVRRTYSYLGAWPMKINGIELNRLSSENTIEYIEFCVDKELVV